MDAKPTFDAFRADFRRSVACWQSLFDKGRTGTEYAALTPAEIEVFEIRPERYAAMVALFEAYEAVKNICDIGTYSADLCAAMREALGQVVGVTYREAFAMFYKVHFAEIRSGLFRFKDEN